MSPRGVVTNLEFSRFTVTVGESTHARKGERPWSWDLKRVRGFPPHQLQRKGTQSLSESSSDFVTRKDLRELVQPTGFRQLRCVVYVLGKTLRPRKAK